MRKYTGKVINEGTVVAKAVLLGSVTGTIRREDGCDVDTEIHKLEIAADAVKSALHKAESKAEARGECESADILNSHIMLLEDDSRESLIQRTNSYIADEAVNAEFAVDYMGHVIADELAGASSDYLRARSEDILQLSLELIKELLGGEESRSVDGPSVVVSETVSPETLTMLGRDVVCGIVTRSTSPLSHTAILAKNMNIPFITDTDIDDVREALSGATETVVAIDGKDGTLITDPDEDTLAKLKKQMESERERYASFMENGEELTEDGPIRLYANIGRPEDVDDAVKYHAAGIGLMRSEFLYMDRDDAPDEDEQYEAYVKVLDAMGGKPVIIRTIDIGADKDARCLHLPKEDNPALGLRGIRIGFAYPDIFGTQLRALLRAANGRNLRIMFPMITSADEVERAKAEVMKAADKLKAEGAKYAVPPIGIMVETPAAALAMDEIAQTVDFVSIGTNDLTQYTLGIDRTAENLSEYYDIYHSAVFKLIEETVTAAHDAGIEVGICGELGADTLVTANFMSMGIDELSMAPAKIPAVAAAIAENRKGMEMIIGGEDVLSPVDGYVIPMEEIPDEVFSEGVMGKCVGIYPDNGVITAPFNGTVTMLAKTGHALSIKSQSGMEVLIHIGIDTVNLKGRGFEPKVVSGQEVEAGSELLIFDKDLIKEEGYSPIVVVVKL